MSTVPAAPGEHETDLFESRVDDRRVKDCLQQDNRFCEEAKSAFKQWKTKEFTNLVAETLNNILVRPK